MHPTLAALAARAGEAGVRSKEMKTTPNLFGQALADHFHGEAKGQFMACDETGEHPLDLGFYLGTEPTPSETKALRYAHGKILDVGCGPGRILKFLQIHGQDAVGFDIDQVVIQLCQERGIRKAFVESYDNIDRFSPVDTVLWLNRTLCTAGSLPRIESLLASSRRCCSKEGILIFDSVEVRPNLANDGPGVLQTSVHFRYSEKVGEPFRRTCFSSNIAERMLQKSGWKPIDTIRDGDTYTMVCKRA